MNIINIGALFYRAMAMCISLMMGRVGSVIGTNFVGAVLGTYCELTFYLACFATISAAFLLLFLPRNISLDKSIKNPPNSVSPSNETVASHTQQQQQQV